jgi:hypothetical protein
MFVGKVTSGLYKQSKYFEWKSLQQSIDLKIYVTSLGHNNVALKEKQNADK